MAVFIMFFLVLLSTLQSFTCALFQKKYDGNNKIATSVFSVVESIVVPLFTVGWLMFDIKVSTTNIFVQYVGLNFHISTFTLVIALLNAGALFFYNTYFIKASSIGSYAFLNVAMLFGGILIPIFYTSAFHNETVSLFQIIAIALMLCSFVVMNYREFSFKGTKGMYYIYCFILFVANGAYSTLLKIQNIYMQSEFNEMILLTYAFMGVFAFGTLFCTQKKDTFKVFKMNKKALIPLFFGVFIVAFTMNIFDVGLSLIDTAVFYSVNNGGVIVLATIFSIIFFKEKIRINKIVGIIISVISIFLLTYSA